ncbi:hypothetical protein AV530_002568 [Patagioenas fasciata monilis]|uniref:Uncharacterized protein n=1 Tax=Patagioenas fasciata monilis TaxID=372326 RepID=A0A1V4K6V6_PATFA|nr:hypothetical protein AV530_002568 [Patagioenas fasciata monilis]
MLDDACSTQLIISTASGKEKEMVIDDIKDLIIELDQEKANDNIKEIHSPHFEFDHLISSEQQTPGNVFKKDVTKLLSLVQKGKPFTADPDTVSKLKEGALCYILQPLHLGMALHRAAEGEVPPTLPQSVQDPDAARVLAGWHFYRHCEMCKLPMSDLGTTKNFHELRSMPAGLTQEVCVVTQTFLLCMIK